MNPYKGIKDYCYWENSVTLPAPGQIDPVTRCKVIKQSDKVSTMGSCFAQHISNAISVSGLNYYVAENAPPEMDINFAVKNSYGIFSARYGNVYTVAQALQLFERAFSDIDSFEEEIWVNDKGRFLDPFRPQIQPDGFASINELLIDRQKHLLAVKEIFSKSDWFVFTLGLTEAWINKKTNAIYPLAPGVSGGSYNPLFHEFKNYTADEVYLDLSKLINYITKINPKINILLTVSPVPLIATYENRNVIVSTNYSKSALRVACDCVERKFSNVIYFPSYEIINCPSIGGRYFEDDLRSITKIGVAHVMRIFSKHFINENFMPISNLNFNSLSSHTIVCDEEAIMHSINITYNR
jgi:hypothetical protein